jgi:putative ABC transport system permease protein
MTNDNPGYNYNNIIYVECPGSSSQQREVLIEQINKISGVESVSSASVLLFYPQSGNNISLPGEQKELINFAELYYANDSYIIDMEFNIIKGESFSKERSAPGDILISEDFEEKLINLTNWEDGVIGKTVHTSEKGLGTIVGVYEKIRVGTIIDEDIRPSLISFSNRVERYLFIKMREITLENQNQLNEIISQTIKTDNFTINNYSESILKRYNEARIFRNTILAGGVITTIIMLLGLIAYITNEIGRRSSEIAIRKINGALERDIVKLFIIDIYKLAIPSIIIGATVAYYLSNQILQNFTKKIDLDFSLLALCSIIVLTIITISTYLSCLKISKQNPSDNIK